MLSALEARIRIVQSPSNARVKALRRAITHPPALGRLADASADRPLIALEGFHLVAEAVRAGLMLATLFLRAGEESAALRQLGRDCDTRSLASAELLALPAALYNSLMETAAPQPVAALAAAPSPAWPIAANALVLVLCGLQDPGNVGTLLRSALAFGATGALLLRGTASPFSSRSLRASAGAALHLPLAAVDSPLEAQTLLRARSIRSWAAVPRDGMAPPRALLASPAALWIGAEGPGLNRDELAACGGRLSLPMHAAAESLNAAVAGSLLLYEAARSRAASDHA